MSLADLGRPLLAGWLTLLGSLGLVLGAAAPAEACSCVSAEPAGYVERADTVFTGTLEGVDAGGSTTTYTFSVERVLDGAAPGQPVAVRSASSGAACGLERMRVGRAYVVFAQADGEEWQANLCGGTDRATASYVAEVEAITGPGRAVGTDGPSDAAPASDEREDGGPPAAALVGGGLVVVLVLGGGAALALTSRARAPRSRPSD